LTYELEMKKMKLLVTLLLTMTWLAISQAGFVYQDSWYVPAYDGNAHNLNLPLGNKYLEIHSNGQIYVKDTENNSKLSSCKAWYSANS